MSTPSGSLADMSGFSPVARTWFGDAFAAPTPAQIGAWRAIAAGRNALVVAPTGSGKTLAAFLWALDRLSTTPRPDDKKQRCRVLYVTPLKALAVDVERNLRAPLAGHGADRRPARHRHPRHHRRRPVRRHVARRSSPARHGAARHLDHDARVAVPDADLAGPRGADAASRPSSSTRCTPSPAPSAARTSPCRWSASTRCWSALRSGSGCPRPCGRSRRSPASSAAPTRSRSCTPDVHEAVGSPGRRPGRGHDRARPAHRRPRRARRRQRIAHLDLAARRGADRRPGRAAAIDDRVRQLAPARRATDRPAQRDRRRTRSGRTCPTAGQPGRDHGPERCQPRRARDHRPRPPRLVSARSNGP